MSKDKNQNKNMVLSGNQRLSGTAEDFFRQGVDEFHRGDYRRAMDDFNQALQINPDFTEAYRYRAKTRYYKGDPLGAIQDYSQVLQMNPENAAVYSDRGLIRALLSDRWGAMQDYNQALQIDGNQVSAYVNRSLLRVELEDYPGAIADCDEALRISPNLAEGYLNRGIARFELEDYQEAMADYNQALQINPHLAAAYFNRGMNQVALGAYQEAIADYNQVLQLNPNDAQAYLNRGYVRLQLGENGASIEDFDQALHLDPVAAKAFFNQIAHTLNEEQETIEDQDQQLVQGLLIQGNLRYELGDYQAALNAYNQVLSLDSNNTEAYNRRSTVRSVLGDYKGAMEDLQTATHHSLNNQQLSQLIPTDPIEITAKDYYQWGVDKLQKGEFQGAIEDFNAVLQCNSDDATALTCRGFAYRRLGNDQRAIEDLQKAAKLFYEQGDVKSSQEVVKTLKKLRQ